MVFGVRLSFEIDQSDVALKSEMMNLEIETSATWNNLSNWSVTELKVIENWGKCREQGKTLPVKQGKQG